MNILPVALKRPGIINNNYSFSIQQIEQSDDVLNKDFNGLWRSQGGSLYKSGGGEFVCIYVHSDQYRGWVNKVAIKNIQPCGNAWSGLQAFRHSLSGQLIDWEEIQLEISQNKIIKYFPKHIEPDALVYGYVEQYTRVHYQ